MEEDDKNFSLDKGIENPAFTDELSEKVKLNYFFILNFIAFVLIKQLKESEETKAESSINTSTSEEEELTIYEKVS
jgi:hypothetical protein